MIFDIYWQIHSKLLALILKNIFVFSRLLLLSSSTDYKVFAETLKRPFAIIFIVPRGISVKNNLFQRPMAQQYSDQNMYGSVYDTLNFVYERIPRLCNAFWGQFKHMEWHVVRWGFYVYGTSHYLLQVLWQVTYLTYKMFTHRNVLHKWNCLMFHFCTQGLYI